MVEHGFTYTEAKEMSLYDKIRYKMYIEIDNQIAHEKLKEKGVSGQKGTNIPMVDMEEFYSKVPDPNGDWIQEVLEERKMRKLTREIKEREGLE